MPLYVMADRVTYNYLDLYKKETLKDKSNFYRYLLVTRAAYFWYFLEFQSIENY